MRFITICFISVLCANLNAVAQKEWKSETTGTYSHADSLLGSLRPERTCYDVNYYNMDFVPNIKERTISGRVKMYFMFMHPSKELQIDLQSPLYLDSVLLDNVKLKFRKDGNAYFIQLPNDLALTQHQLISYYHGKPIIAKNAPWDGGLVWKYDRKGAPFVGVACQGNGASIWWPCKDHPSDEPDSVSVSFVVPDTLIGVSNGNLRKKEALSGNRMKYFWHCSYPINAYNVTFYIGNFMLIKDHYVNFKGDSLDLDYWVQKGSEFKVRLHFHQVKGMLHAYEHYFGPYPYFNDGYALVEAPFLGMEHQGAIAYGNGYNRGYLGGRIPDDLNFDFIIIHESGHEYWGNSVSAADPADSWIQESFTTYMEALYVEWTNNKQKGIEYLVYQKPEIANKSAMLGIRNVNYHDHEDSDIYYKGSWVLHSLRNTVNNDSLWFSALKALYQSFAGKEIFTEELVARFNVLLKSDYTAYFKQFLLYKNQPVFEYYLLPAKKGSRLIYRWNVKEKGFNMHMRIGNGTDFWRIRPSTSWQTTNLPQIKVENFILDERSFLFEAIKMTGSPPKLNRK